MTPKEAIEKLLGRHWTIPQIAKSLGVHHTIIYRAHWGHSVPRYETSVALVEMAEREELLRKTK